MRLGYRDAEVACPVPSKGLVPKAMKVMPPSVDTWKMTVPVGVPLLRLTVTVSVTFPPKVIGEVDESRVVVVEVVIPESVTINGSSKSPL